MVFVFNLAFLKKTYTLHKYYKKIMEGLNVIHSVHTDKQQKYIYIATDGTGAYVISLVIFL